MKGGGIDVIKLVSKPMEVNLYMLVHAIVTDNLDEIAENCHYVIEDLSGTQCVVYARNDERFYWKMCSGALDCYMQSNFSSFFNR